MSSVLVPSTGLRGKNNVWDKPIALGAQAVPSALSHPAKVREQAEFSASPAQTSQVGKVARQSHR